MLSSQHDIIKLGPSLYQGLAPQFFCRTIDHLINHSYLQLKKGIQGNSSVQTIDVPRVNKKLHRLASDGNEI